MNAVTIEFMPDVRAAAIASETVRRESPPDGRRLIRFATIPVLLAWGVLAGVAAGWVGSLFSNSLVVDEVIVVGIVMFAGIMLWWRFAKSLAMAAYIRGMRKRNPPISTRFTATPDGLQIEDDLTLFRAKWKLIRKVVTSDEGIILLTAVSGFHIPATAFPDKHKMSDFADLLANYVAGAAVAGEPELRAAESDR